MTHNNEKDRTCAQHGDTLVWEVGGPRRRPENLDRMAPQPIRLHRKVDR